MWPFKQKKILDLTQSRIKVPESVRTRLEKEYKDFYNPSSSSSVQSGDSALGFLSSLASSSSQATDEGSLSLKHLKVKIEDIEYKLDSLNKRLASFIDRVDLTEKKVDRIERRGV